jgi:hypothetical protein
MDWKDFRSYRQKMPMMKGPDSLLVKLMKNVTDFQKQSGYSTKLLREFDAKKVDALKGTGFLKEAPMAVFIECPESGCLHCTVAVEVEEKDGELFACCCRREDIARIPIQPEDVQLSRVDFFEIAVAIAKTFGREVLNVKDGDRIKVCYLNGYELFLTPGAPVCVQIESRKITLAECFRWTGTTFTLINSRIESLLPPQGGKAETTIEKLCRVLRRFMELKEKETRVEARYKLMATELNKSWYEVKRLVQRRVRKILWVTLR